MHYAARKDSRRLREMNSVNKLMPMSPAITPESLVYIAGHNGMVGAAIMRNLQLAGYKNILTRPHSQLDLTNQRAVRDFFAESKPSCVFLAAARVGGIHANNTYPAEFIYQNLMIEANIIDSAWRSGTERLLFLGSSCIYPRLAKQPMSETALLTGNLEPTNEPYALAKIAGIKLCESYSRQYGVQYRSVMPTNLYGSGDNFNLENSHVIPALIRKIHNAKVTNQPTAEVWGSGNPMREFLHVDDMANACRFVMELADTAYESATKPMLSHLNIGTGNDVSIGELAKLICQIVDYPGEIIFNTDHPDGAPRKLMDVTKIQKLGWQAAISLSEGLTQTYDWFLDHQDKYRR
ncbi:GDP-L-fucose synthetase [hydrothermal vent metagenome]|uniref:GDP-L-fucose synthase n=1 Tax=hydrothermal vent metagenome TaxID=652676 RepID=A0A3B1AMZ5_9ZZZZ